MYHGAAMEDVASARHFSPRRRTAVVLTGEGTGLAYLTGVVKALAASGVRLDLLLGRGAGAIVAAFAAVDGNGRLHEPGGLLESFERRKPYALRPFYRLALVCVALAFAFFLAPALVGLISIVAIPVRALVAWLSPQAEPATDFLTELYMGLERYYLPAIAIPIVALFLAVTARWLATVVAERRLLLLLSRDLPFAPAVELAPLAEALSSGLWQIVRGASTSSRPPSRAALGEAYRGLLEGSLGQHGFRELVLYALDTETGEEVPFVALKERYTRKVGARRDGAEVAEPIDLCSEGAQLLADALLASVSPPGLVAGVPLKLPLGSRFGGEVHRFSSSLVLGEGALADAVACGAEQVLYVCSAAAAKVASGSAWERLSTAALRSRLAEDLAWAAASGDVPVFVIRPEVERLRPFELSGRRQLGRDRLTPMALVAQGERDALQQFVYPVLGEDLPSFAAAPPDSAVPVARENWDGPKEL